MLTDSNCLLGQEKESVLLSKIANARVDSVNYLSEDSSDCDCSYREVFCQKCNEKLGRFYVATPFSLDSLRNRYSLSIDKLNEYRIQDVELEFQIPEDKAKTTSYYYTGVNAERAANFVIQLRKLEKDVLQLYNRIEQLHLLSC